MSLRFRFLTAGVAYVGLFETGRPALPVLTLPEVSTHTPARLTLYGMHDPLLSVRVRRQGLSRSFSRAAIARRTAGGAPTRPNRRQCRGGRTYDEVRGHCRPQCCPVSIRCPPSGLGSMTEAAHGGMPFPSRH